MTTLAENEEKWSAMEDALLLELHAAGELPRTIARRLQRSTSAIRRRLADHEHASDRPTQTSKGDPRHGPIAWVYLIRSVSRPSTVYVGQSTNPSQRLETHRRGRAPGSSAWAPWDPVALFGPYPDLSAATIAERSLKQHVRVRSRTGWSPADFEFARGLGEKHPWVAHPYYDVDALVAIGEGGPASSSRGDGLADEPAKPDSPREAVTRALAQEIFIALRPIHTLISDAVARQVLAEGHVTSTQSLTYLVTVNGRPQVAIYLSPLHGSGPRIGLRPNLLRAADHRRASRALSSWLERQARSVVRRSGDIYWVDADCAERMAELATVIGILEGMDRDLGGHEG